MTVRWFDWQPWVSYLMPKSHEDVVCSFSDSTHITNVTFKKHGAKHLRIVINDKSSSGTEQFMQADVIPSERKLNMYHKYEVNLELKGFLTFAQYWGVAARPHKY